MEYMGIDYHKQYSFITCINDETGEIRQKKLSNSPEAIGRFINNKHETHAVLEASRTWHVMYELLKDQVATVKLAHPLKVKAIASAKIKTDKIDSCILAELLAADLIPEAHIRDGKNRRKQSVLRQRAFIVANRTRIKNRIHFLIDSQPRHITKALRGLSDIFGKAGMLWLRENEEIPKADRVLLDQMLTLYDSLTSLLDQSDSMVNSLFAEDNNAQLLITIPGIGKFLAILISTEIDNIGRFLSPDKLASYTGLVPSTYASGGMVRHGKITKQGNKWLRWAFIEAAHSGKRHNAQFSGFYTEREHRIGNKKAYVALARRISIISFKILKEQRVFKDYQKPNNIRQTN